MPNALLPELTIAVPEFPRLNEYAGVWAMEPRAAAALWETAKRIDFTAHMSEPAPKPVSRLETVPTSGNKSIAVINVLGTLMKQQPSMGEGSSTVQLRRDIRQAATDTDIAAILLVIDSPGGSVAGTDDLAKDIKAARKQKPVWAQVEDLGASAAYWVACQAEKIFANSQTALVGSIGTLLTIDDLSEAAAQEGVKVLLFSTGPLKGAGTPGTAVSEEHQAYFQAIVNDTQKTFDDAVRKGRQLTDAQLRDVRSGAVYVAPDALDRNLIDGIQTLDTTIGQLAAEVRARQKNGAQASLITSEITTDRAAVVGSPKTELPVTHFEEKRPMAEHANAAPKAEDTVTAPAANAPAPNQDKALADIVEATRIENARRQRITEMVAETLRDRPDLIDTADKLGRLAIDGKWQPQQLELELLRASRPGAPIVLTSGPKDVTDRTIEAAVCIRAGLPNVEKHFDERTLEVSQQHFKRGLGLQELLLHFAHRNGYRGFSVADLGSVMKAAFRENGNDGFSLRSSTGPSTYSLPGILGNVANKFLAVGFEGVETAWRDIASIRNVSDFKEISSYSLTGDLTYEQVAPGGELKHGSMTETAYGNKADTYGRMLGIDRRDVINDDIGAFASAGRRLGRGGALKLNLVFWTEFMDNLSFFTTARGNYDEGSDTVLDIVGLELADVLFRTQTDPDGNPLGLMPAILLVPPALRIEAMRLMNSTTLNETTTANAGVPNANPWAGAFRVSSSQYLQSSSITGNSAKKWYIIANPSDLPVIEVAFLNGVQTPTVEQADMDFDRLGVSWRGYHDFGVRKQEYRAGVAMKGET